MLNTIQIRQAQMHDVDALSMLAIRTYTVAFGDSMSASDLIAHLDQHLSPRQVASMIEHDVVLVAEIDQQLVGYVQFGAAHESANPTDQELRRLYVDADWHNQQIGTRLIESALNHAQMRAAANIYLDVWEKNHAAQRLYQRHGFVVIGRRRFAVASGVETDDDLIMWRQTTNV